MLSSSKIDEVFLRLERIQQLTDRLVKVRDDAVEQQSLAEQIRREILTAQLALKPDA